MAETSQRARKRAPNGSQYCFRGHLKDKVSPSGKPYCQTCINLHAQRRTEAGRQARLAARRERIRRRPRPSRADCSWAAGLFEGEGTISLSRLRKRRTTLMRVTVVSTDRSVVRFFETRWPGTVVSHRPDTRNGRARLAYVWSLSSCDAIEGFLLDLRPHLRTARVRRKARLMLQDVRARIELRRTDEALAEMTARMEQMQRLNRRGVDAEEAWRS